MQWMHANRPSKETNALQLEVQLRGAYKKHFDHYAYIIGGFPLSYYQYFQPAENSKLQKEIKIITSMLRWYSIFVCLHDTDK